MNLLRLLALLPLVASAAVAADLSAVPAGPIAIKKELLFADDFEGATPAKVWHRVVPSFAVLIPLALQIASWSLVSPQHRSWLNYVTGALVVLGFL